MLSQNLVFDFPIILTLIELVLIQTPKYSLTIIKLVPSQNLVFYFGIIIILIELVLIQTLKSLTIIKLVLSQKLVFDFEVQ